MWHIPPVTYWYQNLGSFGVLVPIDPLIAHQIQANSTIEQTGLFQTTDFWRLYKELPWNWSETKRKWCKMDKNKVTSWHSILGLWFLNIFIITSVLHWFLHSCALFHNNDYNVNKLIKKLLLPLLLLLPLPCPCFCCHQYHIPTVSNMWSATADHNW